MSLRDIDADEETALLPDNVKSKRLPTPLPKFQISIVLLLQICEPLTSQSIYPYINQVSTLSSFSLLLSVTSGS